MKAFIKAHLKCSGVFKNIPTHWLSRSECLVTQMCVSLQSHSVRSDSGCGFGTYWPCKERTCSLHNFLHYFPLPNSRFSVLQPPLQPHHATSFGALLPRDCTSNAHCAAWLLAMNSPRLKPSSMPCWPRKARRGFACCVVWTCAEKQLFFCLCFYVFLRV